MAVPQITNVNDITTVISALASRQATRPRAKPLTGPKRAAILMLALGEQYGGKVWALLDDDEVRELSIHMSTLGTVEADVVEDLLLEFVSRMSASGALMGTFDATERLLQQYLPSERVTGIMDEIRGPAGRNMWEKLSNVQEEVLANYLKNEYPQTIAVVLSRLKPEHAARVLAILPEDLALDVVARMLKMEAVQKEVIERVEQTLRTEFMSNLSQTRRRDAHEVMAEIFNNFDRQTETRFITSLEEENRDSAERIKALMFTFDDLIKLDSASAQTLMRNVDKDKLGIALKSANEEVRSFFLGNMSSRAGKMLLDDMAAMGPVRLREVDEAQALLVNLAKDMAAKGEITLTKNRADDELVYLWPRPQNSCSTWTSRRRTRRASVPLHRPRSHRKSRPPKPAPIATATRQPSARQGWKATAAPRWRWRKSASRSRASRRAFPVSRRGWRPKPSMSPLRWRANCAAN
jgi:flagellar motor switch protein FliG